MDLALTDEGDDLGVTDGDLGLVVGVNAVAQEVAMRLGHWQGESHYDRTAGVPYVPAILGSHPSDAAAFLIEREILGTPGVVRMTEAVSIEFDDETRAIAVYGRAECTIGEIDVAATIQG